MDKISGSGILATGNTSGLFSSPVLWFTRDLDEPLHEAARATVLESLDKIQRGWKSHGHEITLKALARYVERAGEPSFTWRQLASGSRDVAQIMSDDLEARVFLAVDTKHVSYYQNFAEEWGAVIMRFPSVTFDVEEGCKCFALNRYTGCVFHVMRIGEAGLTEVAKCIGLESERRNWLGVIGYIEGQLRRNPDDRDALVNDNEEFFASFAAHMRTVNIAWRRRVAHIESKYTEEEAERIYISMKTFMDHIATELPLGGSL